MHTEGAEQAIEAEKVLGPGMWQASHLEEGAKGQTSPDRLSSHGNEGAAAPRRA